MTRTPWTGTSVDRMSGTRVAGTSGTGTSVAGTSGTGTSVTRTPGTGTSVDRMSGTRVAGTSGTGTSVAGTSGTGTVAFFLRSVVLRSEATEVVIILMLQKAYLNI